MGLFIPVPNEYSVGVDLAKGESTEVKQTYMRTVTKIDDVTEVLSPPIKVRDFKINYDEPKESKS